MNAQGADKINYLGTWYEVYIIGSNGGAGHANRLIGSLPYTITYSDVDNVSFVKTLYDCLNNAEKGKVSAENKAKLESAVARILFFRQIEDVKTLLAKIPPVSSITSTNAKNYSTDIRNAETAYNALSPEQQQYITIRDVNNYNEVLKKLTELGVFDENNSPSSITGSESVPSDSNDSVVIEQVVTVSGNTAKAQITEKAVDEAIDALIGSENSSITIIPKETGSATSIVVELPASAAKKLSGKQALRLLLKRTVLLWKYRTAHWLKLSDRPLEQALRLLWH